MKRAESGRYAPGSSGNPDGPRPGYRHPKTVLLQQMLDAEGEEVARAALEKAKGGDVAALRLVMERILPPQRRRTVSIDLPPIETAGDIPRVLAALTQAAARGEISPGEAAEFGALVASTRQALELIDLDLRIRRLEEGK